MSKSTTSQIDIKIPCRTCRGSGQEQLPPAYRETYRALTSSWQTTTELLAQLSRVGQTALANRLAYLKKLGLADGRPSERNFRMNEWKRL